MRKVTETIGQVFRSLTQTKIGCAVIAGVTTALLCGIDLSRMHQHETKAGLEMARQIAAQAEGLVLEARTHGIQDPFLWATRKLSEGVEPRVIHVFPARPPEPEFFDWDPLTGAVDYGKIINVEDQQGVRIQFSRGFTGFLGTRARWANDLTILLTFLIIWGVTYLFFTKPFPKKSDDSKPKVEKWLRKSHEAFLKLGICVTHLVRNAKDLIIQAARVKDAIAQIRMKMNGQKRSVEGVHEQMKQISELSQSAKSWSMKIALQPEGPEVGEQAEQLHEACQEMENIVMKMHAELKKLESKIGPMEQVLTKADSDLTDLFKSREEVTRSIKETSLSIATQNKQLDRLKTDLKIPKAS